jgi:TolB protein
MPTTDDSPRWSPDGTKIVFSSTRAGNDEIFMINADGTNPTNITRNKAADWAPRWSPDGTKIAFVSDRGGESKLCIMNADGGDVTCLTPAFSWPAWRPVAKQPAP